MKSLFVLITLFISSAGASPSAPTAALHLITYQSWGFTVDSTPQGQKVRHVLNEAVRLGFKSVVFNFRGHMITGTGSDIRATVLPAHQETEERLLLETTRYAKSLGLSVAFRPILLVVGPRGEFPYTERGIYWWHGNIKPKNIATWFENYYKFHERYLKLAAKAGAEWYSIGAEMHSMTSGFGDRDPKWKRGFPEKWVELIAKARSILGNATKITYGVNYTDQYIMANGQRILGGEIEQWRFYLTENFRKPEDIAHQKALQQMWSALDVIGLDYYRALASPQESFANDFVRLSKQLEARPKSHADQLDNLLTEVALTLGFEKPVYFQEVGYRSVEKCFLSPASYEDRGGKENILHQAVAWEAFFRAYWAPQWPWMSGVAVWQVLVDEGPTNPPGKGFTPIGKALTEEVFQRYLKNTSL